MKREEGDMAVGLVLGAVIVAAGVGFGVSSCSGPAYSGVRGNVSGALHHAKCMVRMCDEDGRCPVWAHEYGKCYMLDKHAREFLKRNEKETSKEVFEEVFVK